MARFKLEDSPEEKDLPVEGFSTNNLLLFVPVLTDIFKIEGGISHMNGKALELCTQRDVYTDKVNILRTIPVEHDKAKIRRAIPVDSIVFYPPDLSDIIQNFLKTPTSFICMNRFIKIILFVHRFPGYLKQFIAVYAPSLSGKTQLAISLDHFTEFPLCPRQDNAVSETLPLKACFRLPCSTAFAFGDDPQTVNMSPLDAGFLKDAVSADYDLLEARWGKLVENPVALSAIINVFYTNKSSTLGLLAFWISSRLNGTEARAFTENSELSGPQTPLTLKEFKKMFEIGLDSKPIVFVLDEFSVFQVSRELKHRLLFLRNLLRASCVVVILMGTNASAINMIDPAAIGTVVSGSVPCLWAQVVTNFFTSVPINQYRDLNRDIVFNSLIGRGLDAKAAERVLRWVEEGSCLKPGVMNYFLQKLHSGNIIGSPADLIWEALLYVGGKLKTRKLYTWGKLSYLVGQVEAIISTTGFVDENGFDDASQLLNDHFASLVTLTNDKNINLFSLYRSSFLSEKLCLLPLSWSSSPNGDIFLTGEPIGAAPLTIQGYNPAGEDLATAPFPVKIEGKQEQFAPRSGYPLYQSDEIGFLSLFATDTPFPLKTKLSAIEPDQRKMAKHRDLFSKTFPGPSLTTRAAFTIVFRHQSSTHPSEASSSRKRDGSFMELVCTAAFVIASQKNGLGGSKITSFLSKFISELGWENRSGLKLSDVSIQSLGSFNDYIIPFVAAINIPCSDALRSIPGVNSGILRMAKDRERIDAAGSADCLAYPNLNIERFRSVFYSLEEKCFSEGIDYTRLNGIPKDDGSGEDRIIAKAIAAKVGFIKDLKSKFGDSAKMPNVHFHFLNVSKLANIQSRSWAKLSAQFPDLSVFVVSNIDMKTREISLKCTVRGLQAFSEAESQTWPGNLAPGATCPWPGNLAPGATCPTCIFITPVEEEAV